MIFGAGDPHVEMIVVGQGVARLHQELRGAFHIAAEGGARTRDWGVLRGGSWATCAPGELRSSYRNVVDRAERDVIYGFRCVLVPEGTR